MPQQAVCVRWVGIMVVRAMTWRLQNLSRIQLSILAVFFLLGLTTHSENAYSKPSRHHRKGLKVEYPSLPPEILAKITGKVSNKNSHSIRVDNALSQDWALSNIGFFEVFNPLVQPVNVQVQRCSNQVTVAVIDTGIDYKHPDLIDNIWTNRAETGPWTPSAAQIASGNKCRDRSCNGIDDDGNGFVDDVIGWDFVHGVALPYDTHGHGTHISGIIGSSAANGVGISGVCPNVSIMALKYYDNSGAGFNNLANTVKAIQYAVKMGANIINYSGGGAEPALAEKRAIEEAQRKGVLFVAAAGNDGHSNDQAPYFPASYDLDNIIGVASINKQNQLLPSSNFGSSVHLAAPGLMILSSMPEGKYGTMSGTSQATAFVTGAAALLASQTPSKDFDFRKVKQWLLRGAKAIRNNEQHRVLAAGILSLPQAIAAQQTDIRKTVPVATEVATRSSNNPSKNEK